MAPGFSAGNFAFTNQYTRKNDDTAVAPAGNLGLSWAAFALGVPTTSTIAESDTHATENPYYAGYIQDAWRITRTLTLNFGLRIEFEKGITERYDRMLIGWDPTLKLKISDAAVSAYAAEAFGGTSRQLLLGSGRFIVRERAGTGPRGLEEPGHVSSPCCIGLAGRSEDGCPGRLWALLRFLERNQPDSEPARLQHDHNQRSPATISD